MVTKIEKFEYFDLNDSSKSWYFDAEEFDPNFPLACSHRDPVLGGYNSLLRVYSYFIVFSEYLRSQKDHCVVIVESNFPNAYLNAKVDGEGNLLTPPIPSFTFGSVSTTAYPEGEPVDPYDELNLSQLECTVSCFRDRKFKFRLCEKIGGHYYLRFIFCAKHDSLEDFRSKFFYTELQELSPWFFSNYGFPYLQTITTQDWDLVKRYFFFMIRNHQYKHAELVHYLRQLENGSYYYPDFADGDSLFDIFNALPEDLRKSPDKFAPRGVASIEYIARRSNIWEGKQSPSINFA